MGWRWLMLACAMSASTGAGPAMVPPPRITNVRAITLHAGVNRVPRFLPDHEMATIIQAWADNGNAHRDYTWVVLRGPAGGQPAGPVVFLYSADDPATGETITASPFDGERVTGDVRLATARIDGKSVSLAIKAVLDWAFSGVIADHAIAMLRWYKFVPRSDADSRPLDTFEIIGTTRTSKRYCNVDLTLRDVASVPLPRNFAGANRVDGCFSGG